MSQPTCSCLLSLSTPLTNHRHNTIVSVQPATASQLLLFLPSRTSSVKRHKTRVSGAHCQNKLLIATALLFTLARHSHVLSIKIDVTPLCFDNVFYSLWPEETCVLFFVFLLHRLLIPEQHILCLTGVFHITVQPLLKSSRDEVKTAWNLPEACSSDE